MTLRKRQLHVLIATIMITLAVIFLYPMGSKLLLAVRNSSDHWPNQPVILAYSQSGKLAIENISVLSPAEAVPILMYHGIVANGDVVTNTSRETFIGQMEMLKQKGYKTISIKELDLFRKGKLTLPTKPIIITFDDGRKDSFYPVDEVLKKLGFKATLFVATIKANENDPFYLNWDELKEMQATSRWEIEAHGRRSHEEVLIDEKGTTGRYLASRMYIQGKSLESIEDYKKRVEQDYINGISDLKQHLGVESHYFAVPLNHYGALDLSNYDGAYNFNKEMTRKYFRLAFVEVFNKDNKPSESFYNYSDSNPYGLARLEVKGMNVDELFRALEHFSPKPAALAFLSNKDTESFLQSSYLLYGSFKTGNSITLMSSTSTPSSRMLFGDWGWENYSIKIDMVREKGRSASVIAYYIDEYNFISLNWGEKSLKLIERIDGKERELASYYPFEKDGEVEIILRIYNGIVSASFNEIVLTDGIPTKLSRGAAGFSVWDPKGAQSTIKKLEIESLTFTPQQFVSVIATTTVATSTLSIPEPISEATATPKINDKTLPYFSNGFNVDDWKKMWGDFSIADGILNIGANASTTGGGAILNGSNSWENYILRTTVNWMRGNSFSLMSRYNDSNNYVACSYSNKGYVRLVQNYYGQTWTLSENYGPNGYYALPTQDLSFSMTVKGNHVECLIDDILYLDGDINTMSKTGGIDLETWDPIYNNSQIHIKDVSVTPL